jgi:hypothetical protein
MNLTRTTLTAGLAALSLAASASPALAQGGGGINNTVVSISPTAPLPATTGGGGGGGGSVSCVVIGGGGGCHGPKPTCIRTLIDPVMQVFVVTCTP